MSLQSEPVVWSVRNSQKTLILKHLTMCIILRPCPKYITADGQSGQCNLRVIPGGRLSKKEEFFKFKTIQNSQVLLKLRVRSHMAASKQKIKVKLRWEANGPQPAHTNG